MNKQSGGLRMTSELFHSISDISHQNTMRPPTTNTNESSWVTVSKETHPKFIACVIEFPHVMKCFENIAAHRAPKFGLEKFSKSPESLDLMLEQFFLPILSEEGLIAKVLESGCQKFCYVAVKQRILIERDALSIQEQAYTVSKVAKTIAMDVTEFDTRDTTLTINLSGPASIKSFQKFMTAVRNCAQNLLSDSNDSSNDCTMNIAFIGRSVYETSSTTQKDSHS